MTPTVASIKAAVAQCYGIDLSRKSDTTTLPRQIAMYLAREMTELSLDEIGSAFDEDATGVREAVKELRMMVTSG